MSSVIGVRLGAGTMRDDRGSWAVPSAMVAVAALGTRAVTALRVLVVDDDALLGMLLADMIEAMTHAVCDVETTQAGAIAAAARCRPDIMIVDALLGRGSGIAAVQDILRAGPVPHVFMSGAPIRGSIRGAGFLQKPFREAELRAAMEAALGASLPPAQVAAADG